MSAYLSRANQLLADGSPDKAKVEFQKALRVKPADPQINYSLAKLEEGEGDLAGAVPHYLRAAVPDGRLLAAQLRIVEILIDSNRLSDALGRINSTIGAFPGNADAIALRADIYARQNQAAQARTNATTALETDATNPRALAVLAGLALQAQDSAAALAFVNRGLARHPDDMQLHQVEAAALLTSNQPDKAVEALRSIVRAAPRNVALQTALAQLEARTENAAAALSNFQAAVTADPANQEMQLAFVKFLAEQAPSRDVVAYLTKLVKDHPETAIYDSALAGFLQRAGDLDQSRAVLERASQRLGAGKEGDQVRVALARVEIEAGRNDLALDRLNNILTSDPQNKDALLVRADMESRSGRTADAVTDLSTVVRQDPVNGRAFQALANAYLLQGKTGLAVDAMKRAVAVIPGDNSAQIQLAAFLARAGDRNGARDIITRLTLQNPQSPAVWAVDAEFAIERKDWNAAAQSIARIRNLPNAGLIPMILEGSLQSAKGNFAAAAQSFQAALAVDTSQNPRLPGDFSRASLAAGKAAEAVSFLSGRIPALQGRMQQQAWAALMTLQDKLDNLDGARDAYKHVVQLAPKQSDTYIGYVQNLVPRRLFDEARQVAKAGLAAGASPSVMMNIQGWIELSAGNLAEAEKIYKAAFDADPMSLDAANNYASLLTDLEPKNVPALTAVRNALAGAETSPNPDVIDTIAWLDYRLGRFDEAKNLLQGINAGQSQNPQVRFHFAAALIAAGDKAAGLSLLDTTKGLQFLGSQEAQALSAT